MKTSIALAGLLAAGHAVAAPPENACMPMSEYQFQVANDQVLAMREGDGPSSVILRNGKLFVENQWVTLSSADQQRVRDLEKGLRALEPRIQDENARTGEVQHQAFRGLAKQTSGAGSAAQSDWQNQLRKDRAERRFRIGPMSAWQAQGGEKVMAGMADSMLGVMVDLLRNVKSMRDTGTDAGMDGMSDALAKLPLPGGIASGMHTQLCREFQSLNEVDNALTYRYKGEPLELIRVLEPNFR